jgi:hypothetical protein
MKDLLSTCALVAGLLSGAWGLERPAQGSGIAGDGEMGFLDVSSEPSGAKILIDDADLGQATPQHHLPVHSGHHRLTLVAADGAHKLSIGFTVESGQTKKLTLYLAK